VVFTLPAPIVDIAYQNKAAIYAILSKAAAESLLTIAADPKHLRACIGLTAVFHTWARRSPCRPSTRRHPSTAGIREPLTQAGISKATGKHS
jgi:hypothetical protein